MLVQTEYEGHVNVSGIAGIYGRRNYCGWTRREGWWGSGWVGMVGRCSIRVFTVVGCSMVCDGCDGSVFCVVLRRLKSLFRWCPQLVWGWLWWCKIRGVIMVQKVADSLLSSRRLGRIAHLLDVPPIDGNSRPTNAQVAKLNVSWCEWNLDRKRKENNTDLV